MNRQLIVRDGRGTRDVLLVGSVAVGRDPACEISADDPLLSRRHAEFRVTGEGVVLTDLESRNGLRVNGVATRRAVLRNGDEVQIAGLVIQLVDKSDSSITTAPSSSAAPASSPDDEGTVVLFSPPPTGGATGGSGTRPSAPPREGTVVLPADGRQDARRTPEPPQAARRQPPRTQKKAAEPAEERQAVARSARTSWVSRMYVQVVGLAAFTAILIAVVMSFWQVRTVNAIGVSRATALAHWLAADAYAELARGRISASGDAIGRERGVVAALVIGLDGRVLAPASRAGETFATLPALNTPPSDLYVLKSGRAGGLVHVARPISNAANVRQAVALVSFRPTVGDGGSAIVVLGPALLIVLAVALVVAASIRRTTVRGLALFNEDIELAIGGQLDAVKDPLGIKPIRDLADTINYLIARTRVGASVPSSAGSASRGAAPPEAPPVTPEQRPVRSSPPRADAPRTPAASTHNPARVEARIVADPKFRVIEASPECQQLIGVPPKEMIGEHLVQALQSKPLAEAVLTCLGSLPPSGELRSTVRRDQGVPLDLHVSRAGKDQPVVILIRASESRVPA